MIRKAIIVVLTVVSLWTLFSWGLSHVPGGSAWFSYGSASDGMEIIWYVRDGASILVHRTYGNVGRGVHKCSYNPPPIWGFLLLIVASPAVVFARGPFRRWERRRNGLCVACGTAILGAIKVCSECGADVGCLLKMTSSRWFTLTALHAAIMLVVAFALVLDGAYSGAILFVLLALAAPIFGLVWGKVYTRRYNKRYMGFRFCSTCQYDLTGNESGVCPECGSKTSQPLINRTNE